ncbi:hypothetical protein D1AOALGA4SA_10752 [Olavius algarvensis Delta 1 endosymbiont]|nr:hypothetical protein D1AOALGA4SA_10752 [Olavius algarvensis Delta 1 endosymbiont]
MKRVSQVVIRGRNVFSPTVGFYVKDLADPGISAGYPGKHRPSMHGVVGRDKPTCRIARLILPLCSAMRSSA